MKASKSTLSDLKRLSKEAARRAQASPPATKDMKAAPTAQGAKAQAPLLDDSDRALFRQAMRYVQPLKTPGERSIGQTQRLRRDPEPLLLARRLHAQGGAGTRDTEPVPVRQLAAPLPAPDERAFLRTGCGTDLLRGLKRGKWTAQATLDLHGCNQDQAHERLDRFLSSCLAHGVRCVRVIHGKGIGSPEGEPILKSTARRCLCRAEAVQAWVQCQEREGGAGAVLALLRLPTI